MKNRGTISFYIIRRAFRVFLLIRFAICLLNLVIKLFVMMVFELETI